MEPRRWQVKQTEGRIRRIEISPFIPLRRRNSPVSCVFLARWSVSSWGSGEKSDDPVRTRRSWHPNIQISTFREREVSKFTSGGRWVRWWYDKNQPVRQAIVLLSHWPVLKQETQLNFRTTTERARTLRFDITSGSSEDLALVSSTSTVLRTPFPFPEDALIAPQPIP